MVDVKINKDNSEIISYDEAGIPIYIREGYLSAYPEFRALCHWHEDIEFIYIVDGQMDYFINGKNVTLKKDTAIMVNSSRLHYGYSTDKEECQFYCIILHPSLITTNKKLYTKFVEPITNNQMLDYILFDSDDEGIHILKDIVKQKTSALSSYELNVISSFYVLWNQIYNRVSLQYCNHYENMDMDLVSQRQMVSYIYQNYANNISLDDIALAGKVCRSKCCKIFKKYVGQSPMDFLNSYRLECSQNLLLTTSFSITEICISCGFNHLSYFSKQFQTKYGCTPRSYRKKS